MREAAWRFGADGARAARFRSYPPEGGIAVEAAVAFLALLGLVLIGGAVCGIVALIWLAGVDRRLRALQRYVSTQSTPAQARDAVPPRPAGAPAPAEPQPAR